MPSKPPEISDERREELLIMLNGQPNGAGALAKRAKLLWELGEEQAAMTCARYSGKSLDDLVEEDKPEKRFLGL